MGLLDDAIREHLELKRRQGADAAEISRLESEALAPVQRSADGTPDLSDTVAPEPAPAPAWQGQQTAAHPAPPAYQPPPAPDVLRPPAAYEADRGPAWEPEPEPAPADEPPGTSRFSRFNPARLLGDRQPPPQEPARPTAVHKTPAPFEPPTPPPPAYEPPPTPPSAAYQSPPPAPPPAPYQSSPPAPRAYEPPPPPPAAYHPPPPPPADEEPEGEDLLEETPEFLEETPEHDRLWFEQRPPRDFDFDG